MLTYGRFFRLEDIGWLVKQAAQLGLLVGGNPHPHRGGLELRVDGEGGQHVVNHGVYAGRVLLKVDAPGGENLGIDRYLMA